MLGGHGSFVPVHKANDSDRGAPGGTEPGTICWMCRGDCLPDYYLSLTSFGNSLRISSPRTNMVVVGRGFFKYLSVREIIKQQVLRIRYEILEYFIKLQYLKCLDSSTER